MVHSKRTSVPREATWGLELSRGSLELSLGPCLLSHSYCSTASLCPSICCVKWQGCCRAPLTHPKGGGAQEHPGRRGSLPSRAHNRRWFWVPVRILFWSLSGCQGVVKVGWIPFPWSPSLWTVCKQNLISEGYAPQSIPGKHTEVCEAGKAYPT